ncbi:MAG: hypothetical protein Q8R86_05535 [Sulfuricurvum sp.]|nr:hypothetical protein [Sulfuricurvum sp.]
MKLIIKKDQDSAFFGGMNFLVKARVELTNEEQELVKKYKVENQILLETTSIFGPIKWTIRDLTSGLSKTGKNVAEVLQYEEIIKQSCEQFKILLEIMKNFGGEETYEF